MLPVSAPETEVLIYLLSIQDEHFEEKEIEGLIQKFIEGLDDQLNKDIFILHFIKEKTPKEIISVKDIPRATVYRKINHLRNNLLNFYRNL